MNTIQTDRPLTVEQAAEYTGYTKSYLYKLIFQKKIPHYKPEGGRILFSLDDLKAFCFRNRQAAEYELQEQKEKKRDEKKRPDEKAENRKEADVHRASGSQTVDHPDIGIRPDTWIEKRVRD